MNTGEPISIENVFSEVDFSGPGYQDVKEMLDSISLDYVLKHPDDCERDTALWTIDSYTVKDYNFFIQEDGEIILCFPTYALGYGAQGPTLIPTGIYV